MVHYDSIENGEPSGDRGLILMENMHSVEKVLGVDTFVLKGDNKVHYTYCTYYTCYIHYTDHSHYTYHVLLAN